MANWYGTARSNYVKAVDVDALKAAMEFWDISVEAGSGKDEGKVCLLCETEDGGWPSSVYDEETEGDVEFDFADHVMPHVVEGEVLIVMEAGAEKLRYITGWSGAFVRAGDDVKAIYTNIDKIYGLVESELGASEFTFVEY